MAGRLGLRTTVAPPAVPLRLVVLRDSHEHPQIARRREASVELAEQRGIEVSEIAAEGDRPLDRLATWSS